MVIHMHDESVVYVARSQTGEQLRPSCVKLDRRATQEVNLCKYVPIKSLGGG